MLAAAIVEEVAVFVHLFHVAVHVFDHQVVAQRFPVVEQRLGTVDGELGQAGDGGFRIAGFNHADSLVVHLLDERLTLLLEVLLGCAKFRRDPVVK